LKLTKAIIKELTKELKGKLKELNKIKKVFETTLDPTLERGISSKKISVDLFDTDDVEETDDGIIIWDGDDIYDDEEKIIIESE